MIEFKKTLVPAVYIAGKTDISCLDGKPFYLYGYRVRGREYPVVIETRQPVREMQPGERVQLIRIGSGKYASYKLTEV